MDVDGEHNGANYVAYTFYLKNKTLDEHDYHYELAVQSTSKNVDTASWVMVFKNGEQQIYAQENPNGYAECIYSKWEFPFMEYAEDVVRTGLRDLYRSRKDYSVHGLPVKLQVLAVKIVPHSIVMNIWQKQQKKARNNQGLTTK